MASQAAEKLNSPGEHAFKALKARLIPAWGYAPGKYQTEDPSYLPETGVQREARNDGIVFFHTGTEDRGCGGSATMPCPSIDAAGTPVFRSTQ